MKHARRAQHARIQELEQAPQFAQMILHRRAAERQAMRAAQQAHRLGRRGARVLDRLRFVEHHVIELDVRQPRGIAAQRAVGGQDQIVRREVARRRGARPV